MTMATKQEIFEQHRAAYRAAGRKEKGQILDALEGVTGLHRKGVIRRLGRPRRTTKRRGPARIYGADVTAALKEVWQIGHEICGERLDPSIAGYVRVLKRDGRGI